MKLLIFVLNQTDKLDDVLSEFVRNQICGATVLESRGMARLLSEKHDEDEIPFLGSLRTFLHPEHQKSNVIIAGVQDDQLFDAVRAIERVVGDLSNRDTGVLFSVPIDFSKGICEIGK